MSSSNQLRKRSNKFQGTQSSNEPKQEVNDNNNINSIRAASIEEEVEAVKSIDKRLYRIATQYKDIEPNEIPSLFDIFKGIILAQISWIVYKCFIWPIYTITVVILSLFPNPFVSVKKEIKNVSVCNLVDWSNTSLSKIPSSAAIVCDIRAKPSYSFLLNQCFWFALTGTSTLTISTFQPSCSLLTDLSENLSTTQSKIETYLNSALTFAFKTDETTEIYMKLHFWLRTKKRKAFTTILKKSSSSTKMKRIEREIDIIILDDVDKDGKDLFIKEIILSKNDENNENDENDENDENRKLVPLTMKSIDEKIIELYGPEPELCLHFGSNVFSGYPVWQLRITEIIFISNYTKFDIFEFASALDQYASTQQRLGK